MKIKSLLLILLILIFAGLSAAFRNGCGYYYQCASASTGNVRAVSSVNEAGTPMIIIAGSNGIFRQFGGNMCSVTQVLTGNYYGCAIAAGTPAFIYAVGDSGKIMVSNNRGTTWTLQTSGTIQRLNSIVMVNQQYGLITGNNSTVLRTTNGGISWIAVTPPLTDNNLTFNIYDAYYRFISQTEQQIYVIGESRTLRY